MSKQTRGSVYVPPFLRARFNEAVAAQYLKKVGYRVMERDYRCQAGEVPIVAKDGRTLVFVWVGKMPSKVRCRKVAGVYLSMRAYDVDGLRFDRVEIGETVRGRAKAVYQKGEREVLL